MAELEKAARNYLLNEHISPINDILHKCDLKVEMQYHTDIENAFKAGANWQYEQFEKERLKHCDELTAEQAQMESDFVVQHLEKYNRTPTFIDAIEYGRNITSKQAMKYLQEHHSPSEMSDFQAAMNIAVAKAIDSTINKSIEWLKDNICYDENGDGNMEWVVMFMDDDEMVENFKKFMEE